MSHRARQDEELANQRNRGTYSVDNKKDLEATGPGLSLLLRQIAINLT